MGFGSGKKAEAKDAEKIADVDVGGMSEDDDQDMPEEQKKIINEEF